MVNGSKLDLSSVPTWQASPIADGYSFLEAPRWHEGALFLSDFFTHQVLRMDADHRVTVVCEVPGQPAGLGFRPDGTLLVVSMTDRRLLHYDGSVLTEVADLTSLTHGLGNDMLVDPAGRAYICNFGAPDLPESTRLVKTNLVRVDPNGDAAVAAPDMLFPNGPCMTRGGRTLFVAETFAGRITSFSVDEAGGLSHRREWATFGDEPAEVLDMAAADQLPLLPDGMTVDAEGALWVADAGGSGAVRVVEGGMITHRVTVDPSLAVFAVCLGGPDGRTLFLCASPLMGTADVEKERLSVLYSTRVDVGAT